MYYVTNVVDYATRFPLASVLSPTRTTQDVIEAVKQAVQEAEQLSETLPSEVVLVSDNGPPFTSKRFRQWVKQADVPFRHIQARAHHPQSIGMVERYHQSLKYEAVWMNDYEDPIEARHQIEHYRKTYAYHRPHQALGYRTPADYYVDEQHDESLRITA